MPVAWRKQVERVLISERQLARRVRQLSGELEAEFKGRDLAIVSLLSGTVLFLADLVRHLSIPLRLDFIGVSSYGEGTSPGELPLRACGNLLTHNRQSYKDCYHQY